jgi:two-component system response regulator HydG
LRVVKFEVPPLRNRKKDIPALVESYVNKFANLHGKPITAVTDEVMEMIKSYNWPGNVRELVNCIESCVVMTRSDTIDLESIPEYLTYQAIDSGTDMEGGTLQKMERKLLGDTLKETGGDKTKAAKQLGIGLRTLYRKVEKYGLPY